MPADRPVVTSPEAASGLTTRQACREVAKSYLRRAINQIDAGNAERALADMAFAETWLNVGNPSGSDTRSEAVDG